MTMQVAMVGVDGIVLASDTRYAHTQRSENFETRHTSLSSKMRFSEGRDIVIACAKSMETSRMIADAILDGLTDNDWTYPILPIERIAQRVVDSVDADRKDSQCLIVSTHPTPRLFQVETATVNGEPGRSICHDIKDKAISGDRANAAIFWAERYYKKESVESLIPLAAHMIVSAGKLNPASIHGLEVVVCDSGGCRFLPDDSIASLESAASQWDENIGSLFYDHVVEKEKFDAVLRRLIDAKPQTFKETVAKHKPRKDGGIKRSAKRVSPDAANK